MCLLISIVFVLIKVPKYLPYPDNQVIGTPRSIKSVMSELDIDTVSKTVISSIRSNGTSNRISLLRPTTT